MADQFRVGDADKVILLGSADGGTTWEPIENPVGGGGGGPGGTNTEYLEGATDASIAGIAFMWEDTGDTLRAVSAAKPLPVAVQGTVPVSGTFWQATQPVSGTFWQATQPVSGPLTDTQLRASAVPVSLASVPSHAVTNAGTFAVQATGTVTAVQDKAASASVNSVACSTSVVTLAASNANRKSLVIFNDTGQILFVKFGASATTSDFTLKIPNQAVYELPFAGLYTGAVTGILSTGSGNARVTEV